MIRLRPTPTLLLIQELGEIPLGEFACVGHDVEDGLGGSKDFVEFFEAAVGGLWKEEINCGYDAAWEAWVS